MHGIEYILKTKQGHGTSFVKVVHNASGTFNVDMFANGMLQSTTCNSIEEASRHAMQRLLMIKLYTYEPVDIVYTLFTGEFEEDYRLLHSAVCSFDTFLWLLSYVGANYSHDKMRYILYEIERRKIIV